MNSGNCINISEFFVLIYYWGIIEEVCFSVKLFGLDCFGNWVSFFGLFNCLWIGGWLSVGFLEGCECYYFDIDFFV